MFQLLTNSALRSVFNKAASMQKTVNTSLNVTHMKWSDAQEKLVELENTIQRLQVQRDDTRKNKTQYGTQLNELEAKATAIDDLIARFTAELEALNG